MPPRDGARHARRHRHDLRSAASAREGRRAAEPCRSRDAVAPRAAQEDAHGQWPLVVNAVRACRYVMTNTRASVDEFVAQPALALVGASRSGHKFGNAILRELRAKGMHVYPVHPVADEIDGVPCYRHFADLPEPVGGVIVSVAPAEAISVVRDASE